MTKSNSQRIKELTLKVKTKDREAVVLYIIITFLAITSLSLAVGPKDMIEMSVAACETRGYDTGRIIETNRKNGQLILQCSPLNSYK